MSDILGRRLSDFAFEEMAQTRGGEVHLAGHIVDVQARGDAALQSRKDNLNSSIHK